MQWTPSDAEAIELATCDAVAPARTARLGPWLLSLDSGTVGRARTAVALTHAARAAQTLADQTDAVVTHYREAGLEPGFRLAERPALQPTARRLQALGFVACQPTWVMTARTSALLSRLPAPRPGHAPQLRAQPDADWAAVYSSEGFDPVDGADRVRLLGRARQAQYASLRVGGEVGATGVLVLSQGWASVHGLRTRVALQRQGLCTALLHAMAHVAQMQGVERFFLQVEADNPAISLYQRAGFEQAWRYQYWWPTDKDM